MPKSKDDIDFEDIKWGSFTKQFNAYNKKTKDKLPDLNAFAHHVLDAPKGKKFSATTKKRANFYLNVLDKKGGSLEGGAEPPANVIETGNEPIEFDFTNPNNTNVVGYDSDDSDDEIDEDTNPNNTNVVGRYEGDSDTELEPLGINTNVIPDDDSEMEYEYGEDPAEYDAEGYIHGADSDDWWNNHPPAAGGGRHIAPHYVRPFFAMN